MDQWNFLHFSCRSATALQLIPLAVLVSVLGHESPAAAGSPSLNQQLQIPLNNGTRSSARDRADQLVQQGKTQEFDGFPEQAIQSWKGALLLYQEIGDLEAENQVYTYLGGAYLRLGRVDAAEDTFRQRLAISRDRQDAQGEIYALNNLARVLVYRRNAEAAASLLNEAIARADQINSPQGRAISYASLGMVVAQQGRIGQAVQHYETALTASRRSGDRVTQATILNGLGDIQFAQRDYSQAVQFYAQAARLARDSRDRPNQYRAIDGMVAALTPANDNQKILELLTERLDIAQIQDSPRQELLTLQAIAQVHQRMGNTAGAMKSYEEAIAVARLLQDTQQEFVLRERLASFSKD